MENTASLGHGYEMVHLCLTPEEAEKFRKLSDFWSNRERAETWAAEQIVAAAVQVASGIDTATINASVFENSSEIRTVGVLLEGDAALRCTAAACEAGIPLDRMCTAGVKTMLAAWKR